MADGVAVDPDVPDVPDVPDPDEPDPPDVVAVTAAACDVVGVDDAPATSMPIPRLRPREPATTPAATMGLLSFTIALLPFAGGGPDGPSPALNGRRIKVRLERAAVGLRGW